jgi:hypothetical protein
MSIIFKFFPLIAIAVNFLNVSITKSRIQRYIDQDPELKPGYDKFLKGWLLFFNIPFLVMAIGNLTGLTNGPFDYFNPKALNPVVLVFHFSFVSMYLLMAFWIFLNNGANFLARHPGLIYYSWFGTRKDVTTVNGLKTFFALIILSGLGSIATMWILNIPHPMIR